MYLKLSNGTYLRVDLIAGVANDGLILTTQAAPIVPHIPVEDIPALAWFVREVSPGFDLATAFREQGPASAQTVNTTAEPVVETPSTNSLIAEIAAKVKDKTGKDLSPEQLENIIQQIDTQLQEQNLGETLRPKVVSISTGKKN